MNFCLTLNRLSSVSNVRENNWTTIGFAFIIFGFFILFRSIFVCRFTISIVHKIQVLAKRESERNIDWTWRYIEYRKVPLYKIYLYFWKDLTVESFWKDSNFLKEI